MLTEEQERTQTRARLARQASSAQEDHRGHPAQPTPRLLLEAIPQTHASAPLDTTRTLALNPTEPRSVPSVRHVRRTPTVQEADPSKVVWLILAGVGMLGKVMEMLTVYGWQRCSEHVRERLQVRGRLRAQLQRPMPVVPCRSVMLPCEGGESFREEETDGCFVGSYCSGGSHQASCPAHSSRFGP